MTDFNKQKIIDDEIDWFVEVIKYAVKKKLIPTSVCSDVKFDTSREESDNFYLN